MGKVGQILLSIAAIAAVVALNIYAPGIGLALGISTFLVTTIGAVVIAVGFSLLGSLINKPQAPTVEAGKVNVRLSEPPRWINAGVARQGGGVLFAEFDSKGNLWWLVVHSDSILAEQIDLYFDEIKLTLDGQGFVITNDFCLTPKREQYNGTGPRVPYFQIWTTTYSADDPTPPRIAALDAAFPGKWTADHRLVGTTFSVIRANAIKAEDRYKLYRWRGPLGLGEPAMSVVANWSEPYDPRTGEYKATRNPALIWAWFRTHRYGRRKPFDSINWARVGEQADICDQIVEGRYGTHVRYQCGVSVPDSKERHVAEQEILASCDAQIVFDDDGKAWPRVGYYYTPSLSFSRNRDIVAMESVEAQNGESETQGVIVRYLDPEANYTAQPCAPWYNPNYYVEGQAATFLTYDILTCQDHNQAMRLAKTIGMRSQPVHKVLPTVGLRGLRARSERIVNMNYDNTFAGDYEIVTPIEVDPVGVFCAIGMVPIDANRFTLFRSEEKPKPVIVEGESLPVVPMASDYTTTVANSQIQVQFDQDELRGDYTYEFQYIAASDLATDQWLPMTVDMNLGFASTGTIDTSLDYYVRSRTTTGGGRVSEWSDPTLIGSVSIPLTPPTMFTATGGAGTVTLSWRNPADNRYGFTRPFMGTTNVFSAATAQTDALGGLSQTVSVSKSGLAPGTYYFWIQAHSRDDTVTSELVGPVSAVVT